MLPALQSHTQIYNTYTRIHKVCLYVFKCKVRKKLTSYSSTAVIWVVNKRCQWQIVISVIANNHEATTAYTTKTANSTKSMREYCVAWMFSIIYFAPIVYICYCTMYSPRAMRALWWRQTLVCCVCVPFMEALAFCPTPRKAAIKLTYQHQWLHIDKAHGSTTIALLRWTNEWALVIVVELQKQHTKVPLIKAIVWWVLSTSADANAGECRGTSDAMAYERTWSAYCHMYACICVCVCMCEQMFSRLKAELLRS